MSKLQDLLHDEGLQQEAFFNGRQAGIWTALPGIIQSFDQEAMTCEVQPAIQGKIQTESGDVQAVNLPLLLDCPVVFPSAGGCTLTFPIKAGDECLVVFSSRAIDFWWQSGGIQPPAETRMHDLSDGFVILGPMSTPNVIKDINLSAVELRTNTRKAYLSMAPESNDVTLYTEGNVQATVKGALTASVQGDVSIQVQGSATCAINGSLNATVSGDTTLKCPQVKIDASQVTVTGALTVQGPITGQGGFAFTGGGSSVGSMTGNVNLNGSITVTGDVVASGISLASHTHSGVESGPSSTGGPQ